MHGDNAAASTVSTHSFMLVPSTDNIPAAAAAHKHLPEYGSDFQIHIQTPFKKLNIYTATLSIPGDPEPLFLTKSCPTPTEALETLRVMIMVSEDPLTKEKLANLQWEAMVAHHNNQMMRYSPKGLSEQDSDWS